MSHNESGINTIIQREGRERGGNVTIRNFWQRHAQKMSGEIQNAAKSAISTSSISSAGAERAADLGKTIKAGKHGSKGYRSNSARTGETFAAEMRGYAEANPEVPVREGVRMQKELFIPGNPEWQALYGKMWDANKEVLLQEQGLKLGDFSTLSADEQERIAETAEEPVIREWLDNPQSELARLFPPRIAAANFAALFDRKHERMAEKLNNGSEIDLFHNTHKTATEAFLASGVLIRERDRARITKIADVGGSLKILDNWESTVTTDATGNPTTIVTIRGERFNLDSEQLRELADEGLRSKKQKPAATA